MIQGIDPGSLSPGFALVDPTRLVQRKRLPPTPLVTSVSTTLHPYHCEVAVVEGQWFRPGTKQDSIYKLCFSAGWFARGASADEKYVVKVASWKSKLFPGHVSKSVFCNRLERELTPPELALVQARPRKARQDLLDAIGIAWAYYLGCTASKITLNS